MCRSAYDQTDKIISTPTAYQASHAEGNDSARAMDASPAAERGAEDDWSMVPLTVEAD
jgi:hypothetical protein